MRPMVPKTLLKDLRELIAEARQDVARQVNSTLVLLYWRVGKRIRQDILKEKRAEYGEQIVSAVSRELAAEFGQGFSEKNLRHMIRFAEGFPDEERHAGGKADLNIHRQLSIAGRAAVCLEAAGRKLDFLSVHYRI